MSIVKPVVAIDIGSGRCQTVTAEEEASKTDVSAVIGVSKQMGVTVGSGTESECFGSANTS